VFDSLKEAAGANFVQAVLWTGLALVVLVLILVIVRIIRSMTFGTFVAGGRNRKTRLAVMDAAPVDSQRRLVLVRRDDVEHLILIGGPTDLVVERDIRLLPAARRPAAPAEHADGVPRQRPAEAPARPQPERPAQAPRPEPRAPQPQPVAPAAAPKATTPPAPAPVVAVRMPPAAMPAPQAPAAAPPRAPSAPASSAALPSSGTPAGGAKPAGTVANTVPPPTPRLKPLETPPSAPATGSASKMRPRPELSLEDEMNRLLGELSSKKS
jgi:hypothetical protein